MTSYNKYCQIEEALHYNVKRSHGNWIFAAERTSSSSAKDSQPSESCINRKFFPQRNSSGENSQTGITATM